MLSLELFPIFSRSVLAVKLLVACPAEGCTVLPHKDLVLSLPGHVVPQDIDLVDVSPGSVVTPFTQIPNLVVNVHPEPGSEQG